MYLCTQKLKEMKIEQQIMAAAQAAVKALYGQDVPEKMVKSIRARIKKLMSNPERTKKDK